MNSPTNMFSLFNALIFLIWMDKAPNPSAASHYPFMDACGYFLTSFGSANISSAMFSSEESKSIKDAQELPFFMGVHLSLKRTI